MSIAMNNRILSMKAEIEALQKRVKVLENDKDKREQIEITDIGTWVANKPPVIYRKGADRGKSS